MWRPDVEPKLEVWPNLSLVDESEVIYIQMSETSSEHSITQKL